MKALLFPWHIGAGHLGRLVEIGRLLETHAGFRTLVCRDGEAQPPHGLSHGRRGGPRVRPEPRYLVVPDVESAWSQAGYYHPGRVRRDVERDLALIRRERPAVVVSHMQPTAVLAARHAGVPVVSVVDGDFLAAEEWAWMPWARGTGLPVAPYPPSLGALNEVMLELGVPPVPYASRLNWGDRTLVGSVPALDPAPDPPEGVAPAVYCGTLIWSDAEPAADSTPAVGPAARNREDGEDHGDGGGRVRLYVSLGSGELWPGQVDAMLTEAARELNAVVYRQSPDGPRSDNAWLRHAAFGTLERLVAATDLTLTHGGHSTVHAALSAARPVLVAPFMSENEANGRLFLEATGAGRCLWHSEVRDRRLMFIDSTGARHDRPPLTARALVAAVGPLLSDASYASAARRLSRELAACTRRQAETVTTAVRALV